MDDLHIRKLLSLITMPVIHLLIVFMFAMKPIAGNTYPEIGIVGAGIGGTSACHFLRQHFGKDVQIDLYEKDKIGGRIATIEIGGRVFEAGGSILHPKNQYMKNFTQLLGLSELVSSGGRLGLYDGKEMLFDGSSWSIVMLTQLFWRYGWDIVRVNNFVSDMLNKFKRIYDHQAKGYAFTTPEQLIESMSPDLLAHLHYSLKETLEHDRFSERFISELAMAALRTNYGQNTSIQAFVGSVSLAGIESGLWHVQGGNKLIPEKLVKRSGVNLIQSEVEKIVLLDTKPKARFQIVTSKDTKTYDIVIIATPLNDKLSKIKFENFPKPITHFPQHFHRTVATFVRGQPNFPKFGFTTFHQFPEALLTTKDGLFFNSIGKQKPVTPYTPTYKDKQLLPIWKVFSQEPLTDDQLGDLFLSYENKHIVDWMAYPDYKSGEVDLPPFQLHPQLYYINGIEICASAMEMSAIGAHNAALLAYHNWNNKASLIDPDFMDKSVKQEL